MAGKLDCGASLQVVLLFLFVWEDLPWLWASECTLPSKIAHPTSCHEMRLFFYSLSGIYDISFEYLSGLTVAWLLLPVYALHTRWSQGWLLGIPSFWEIHLASVRATELCVAAPACEMVCQRRLSKHLSLKDFGNHLRGALFLCVPSEIVGLWLQIREIN